MEYHVSQYTDIIEALKKENQQLKTQLGGSSSHINAGLGKIGSDSNYMKKEHEEVSLKDI